MSLGLVWLPPEELLDSPVEFRQRCCPVCATLLETAVEALDVAEGGRS